MHRPLICAATAAGLFAAVPAQAHNYPTATIADYVFGCMAANGQTHEMLEKCSCSIDVISSIIPFEEYEEGATVLRMRQVRGGGEKMAIFQDTAVAKDAVERLRRAQVVKRRAELALVAHFMRLQADGRAQVLGRTAVQGNRRRGLLQGRQVVVRGREVGQRCGVLRIFGRERLLQGDRRAKRLFCGGGLAGLARQVAEIIVR